MNLTEATMLALQGRLTEEKYLVSRRNWEIHNDHEAGWFGGDACWADIRELNIDKLSDEDKIKQLQLLKDNIDKEVTNRADYKDIDSKYIPIWLAGYKKIIDYEIGKISNNGKFYIFINVDVSDRGDVDHRGSDLIIENGTIKKGIKYYDTKSEAQKDLDSISKSQYEEFVKDEFIGAYDEYYQWNVEVNEYKYE